MIKFTKVREVMNLVSENFQKFSEPACCQSIDEGMVGFKGRVSFLQYMPAKPTKRGMKLFIRCDSESGYTNEFEVYLGKVSTVPSVNGAYFDVVKRLTDKILNGNHQVFFDNAYTSIPIMLHLLQHRTYACGTVRVNRKNLPAQINKPIDLGRGDFVSKQDAEKKHLTATAWRDTKIVRFLSTMSTPNIDTQAVRRINGVRTNVKQPSCAAQYAKHMGGVDRFDQLRGTFNVGRYSKKAWKYLFYFLLNAAITNSWILYKQTSTRSKKAFNHLRFRHELAVELLRNFHGRRSNLALTKSLANVNHKHVLFNINRARRCRMHNKYQPNGKTKKETKTGCRACNLILCFECHVRFHTDLFN